MTVYMNVWLCVFTRNLCASVSVSYVVVCVDIVFSLLLAKYTGTDLTGITGAQVTVPGETWKGGGVSTLCQEQRCPRRIGHDYGAESSPARCNVIAHGLRAQEKDRGTLSPGKCPGDSWVE